MPIIFQPWRAALQPASFGGAEFHVEVGGQAGGRRAALHEYPKKDTPYAEDMGRRARRWPITGYCIGPFYLGDRDALIAALETEDAQTLVHPSLGEMQVICENYAVTETRERGGIATFEMQFVEKGESPDGGSTDNTPAQVNNAADQAGPAAAAGDKGLSGTGGGVGGINAGAGSGDVTGVGGVSGINSAGSLTTGDLNEAVAVVSAIVAALQACVPGDAGRPGAAFRYACGDLIASAPALIESAALFTPLLDCFESAVKNGATISGMEAVRRAVLAQAPSGQPALWVAGISYCYVMVAEARILSATTFASSSDVFAALDAIGTVFDVGQEWAADNRLPAVYQTLIALGAAVTRDLTTRAVSLPRLVSYAFPRGMTSHALAYRLYGDAGRADELRAENKVIHPAFMPAAGTALSE